LQWQVRSGAGVGTKGRAVGGLGDSFCDEILRRNQRARLTRARREVMVIKVVRVRADRSEQGSTVAPFPI